MINAEFTAHVERGQNARWGFLRFVHHQIPFGKGVPVTDEPCSEVKSDLVVQGRDLCAIHNWNISRTKTSEKCLVEGRRWISFCNQCEIRGLVCIATPKIVFFRKRCSSEIAQSFSSDRRLLTPKSDVFRKGGRSACQRLRTATRKSSREGR